MKTVVAKYLESKKYAWAPTTLASERARLNSMADYLTGDPILLFDFLSKNLKKYSLTTAWTRATQFWSWYKPAAANPYMAFRKENSRLFSNAYIRTIPKENFAAIKQQIMQINDAEVRAKCLQILENGLRFSESNAVSGGTVIGKGGKSREIYGSTQDAPRVAYMKVRAELKKLGLKPHDLRKAFANEMVARGAQPHELTKLMGWSSFQTAQSYIEARPDKLAALVTGGKK